MYATLTKDPLNTQMLRGFRFMLSSVRLVLFVLPALHWNRKEINSKKGEMPSSPKYIRKITRVKRTITPSSSP